MMARHGLSWMDDHLSTAMLDRIVVAVRSGGPRGDALDCLRIPPLPEDERDAAVIVQDRVSDLLDGHDEEASARALDQISGQPHRIDAISLAMLRCTGMDAAVMLAIAHALSRADDGGWANVRLPEFRLTAGPARRAEARVSVEQDGRIAIQAPFAADTAWEDDRTIAIGRPFPHAVCLAMEGRRLSDVVDHPVLTPLGLSVERVNMASSGSMTRIETDRRPEWLRMDELTLESTRPDRRTLAVEKAPRQRVDNTPSF